MPTTSAFTHRFVQAGTRGPVLLLLHGTGGNEDDLLGLGKSLHPSAALLSPRGKVLENGMPRFFRRLAEGVFDEKDLVFRTHELADFVAAAATEYQFGDRKIVAVGYSNGANIAASILLLRPQTLLVRFYCGPWCRLCLGNSQILAGSRCSLQRERMTPSFPRKAQISSQSCSEKPALTFPCGGPIVGITWTRE